MIAASVRTEGSFEVGTRTQLFVSTASDLGYGYDVTRDGRTFAMVRQVRRGEEQTVVVMLNWFDQLGARGK